MAHMLVPSVQCQMGITSNSIQARSIIPAKSWNSLLFNSQRPKTKKRTSTFKVLALKSDNNGTVSRLENLLNMDITPFTDKIIAEYIWYVATIFFLCSFH